MVTIATTFSLTVRRLIGNLHTGVRYIIQYARASRDDQSLNTEDQSVTTANKRAGADDFHEPLMDGSPPVVKCHLQRRLQAGAATQVRGAASAINAVAFDASGRFAILAAQKTISLWNWETGTLVQSYPDATGYDVVDVCTSKDGELVVGCAGKSALLWDVATATVTRKFGRHEQSCNTAIFLGDHLLATGSYDQHIRLFDLRQKAVSSPVQVLKGAKDSVSCLVAPIGTEQLIGASVDGVLRTYDVRQGTLHLDDLGSPITGVCLTNDGECILLSCLDDRLRLLLRETGEVLSVYSGHKSREYNMACSVLYDDSAVCCGSEEEGSFLCIWGLASEQVEKFADPGASGRPICAVASHPKRPIVLTGGLDGIVSVHEVNVA